MRGDKSEMVSVIVPVYNAAQHIPSFFKRLSEQTYKDFEVVFVCDESPDGSKDLLNDGASTAEFDVKVISRTGKNGVGSARDYPLDHGLVRGDYVLFLDVDDEFPSDYISRLVGQAEKYDADMVVCAYSRIDAKTGRVLSHEMTRYPEFVSPITSSPLMALINPAPWNKLIRASVIRDCRFVAPLGEDAMFFAEILPYLNSITFISEPIYQYIAYESSNVSSTSEKGLEAAKNGFVKVRNFYSERYPTHPRLFGTLIALVVLRVGIGMTLRACLSVKRADRRRIIKSTRTFLDKEFHSWRRVRILRLPSLAKLGFKGFLLWVGKVSIKMHCFGLVVTLYKAFVRLFRRDIKW